MAEFLEVLFSVVFLAMVVAVSMKMLVKDTSVSKCSRLIINKFEPDNTAPKLTDMIEYHRTHEKSKYIVGE